MINVLALEHSWAWKPRLPPGSTQSRPVTITGLLSTSPRTSSEEYVLFWRQCHWDPAAALAAETQAHALPYSGLDAAQRAVYDLLCDQGVLDARR